jgi:hypothetical protein
MSKKDLKMYVSPSVEIVNLDAEEQFLKTSFEQGERSRQFAPEALELDEEE